MITRRMAVIPGVVLSCLSAFASATGAQTRPTMDAGGPHRNHGIFGGRASGFDSGDTFRQRKLRSGRPDGAGELPARFRDSWLRRDFVHGAGTARKLGEGATR